ncbi:MAG: hypothetical protein V3T77_04535, partial [Planctomycetota bacterium]
RKPEELGQEAAIILKAVAALKKRRDVDPKKIFLVSYGGASACALEALRSKEVVGWIAVNGITAGLPEPPEEAMKAVLDAVDTPVLAIWGNDGTDPSLEKRRSFGEKIGTAGKPGQVTTLPLAKVDFQMRLTVGERLTTLIEEDSMLMPAGANQEVWVSSTGLALGYARGIARWLRQQLRK